jgi:hypothetical protein
MRLAAFLARFEVLSEGEDLVQLSLAPVGQAEKVFVHR